MIILKFSDKNKYWIIHIYLDSYLKKENHDSDLF